MAQITAEEALQLIGRAKFRRVRYDDYVPFPGIQSKQARIAYVGEDVTIIIDQNDDTKEWFIHFSMNDLLPEQSFRLEKIS